MKIPTEQEYLDICQQLEIIDEACSKLRCRREGLKEAIDKLQESINNRDLSIQDFKERIEKCKQNLSKQ